MRKLGVGGGAAWAAGARNHSPAAPGPKFVTNKAANFQPSHSFLNKLAGNVAPLQSSHLLLLERMAGNDSSTVAEGENESTFLSDESSFYGN
jgi:hypothetical protein